jgi:enoyl-CoA hydratase/carnithine racemase
VVPHAQLRETAEAFARQLIERPDGSLGVMKSLIHRALSCDLPAALEMEAFALSAAMKTEEHQTIVKNFLARAKSR